MKSHKRSTVAALASSLIFLTVSIVGDSSQPCRAQIVSPEKGGELVTSDYDPSRISKDEVKTVELIVKDGSRSREIPLLVYLPSSSDPSAVVVHSHGLGGQKETSPFLGKHWAARGYVAVFLQHPGSDDRIWRDLPKREIMGAMRRSATAENLKLRIGDVTAAIDQLEKWNVDTESELSGRLKLDSIGMSGHSFGAVTTQNVSGQLGFGGNRTDTRIRAAMPLSPSMPRFGNAAKTFENVKIPWMCMTGTKDKSIFGGASVESRLEVFKALPAKNKYELVLHEAEHFVFTETSLKNRRQKGNGRNPNHHVAIKAISTAFWDAYLREDPAAKGWIDNDASVRAVLESEDRWQTK